MHDRFTRVIETLAPSFDRLMQMTPVNYSSLPRSMASAGIYLFSEGDHHLYVGRNRSIRRRLGLHCRPSASYHSATFAFRLAREATSRITPSYTTENSRAALMRERDFCTAFDMAKARIRQMDMRFVEESDPVRQALLELYAAVVLETPYNDFDTH